MSRHTDFVVESSADQKTEASSSTTKKKLVRRGSIVQRTMEDMRRSFATNGSTSIVSTTTASTASTKPSDDQKPKTARAVEAPSFRDLLEASIAAADADESSSSSTIDLTKDSQSKKKGEPAPKKRKKSSGEPRKSVNEWLGVVELARRTRVHSVTCVDPGTRNCAIMRMEFHPQMRITHVHVLDLYEECRAYESRSSNTLNRGGEYSIDALLFALGQYVEEQARAPDGCFNSSMTLVEEQSFGRDMARVEATIVAVINSVFAPLRLTEQFRVPRGQVFSSRSAKSCYRPFFPDLPASEIAKIGSKGRRPFGMGDSRGDKIAEAQRLYNKKNAIANGSLILSKDRIAEVVPRANLSDADQTRVMRAKSDDLYDTLFMCLYFASCYLFYYNKILVKSAAGEEVRLSAIAAPPQRLHNCYQEVFELCAAIGTPRDSVQLLVDKLLTGSGVSIDVAPIQK